MSFISTLEFDQELREKAAQRELSLEARAATGGTLRDPIVPEGEGVVPVTEGYKDRAATSDAPVQPFTGVRPMNSALAKAGAGLVMLMTAAGPALATTWNVPAGGDVQAYIDSTTGSVGDTVALGPNTYTGDRLLIDPTGQIGAPRGGLDIVILGLGPDLSKYISTNTLKYALFAYRSGARIEGIEFDNNMSISAGVIGFQRGAPVIVNCGMIKGLTGAVFGTTDDGTRMANCYVTDVDIGGVVNYQAVEDTLPHLQLDSTSISRGTAYGALKSRHPWVAYVKGWNDAVLTGEGNSLGEGDGAFLKAMAKTTEELPILIDYNSSTDATFRLDNNTYAEPYYSEIAAHGDDWNHAFIKDALDGQGTGRYFVASEFTWVPTGDEGLVVPAGPGRLVTPISDGQLRFAKNAPQQDAYVSLYSVNGRQVMNEERLRPGQVMDLSGLPPGGYLARIVVHGQKGVTQKVINLR